MHRRTAVLAGVWVAVASSVAVGAIDCKTRAVGVDGLGQQFLSGQDGEVWLGDGDSVALGHDQFSILLNACDDGDVQPDHITQLKLLGKTFSYTVDLSKVGCACNLALYLVSAPARDQSGTGAPFKGRGDFYCDANQVGGQWCPEIDIMEANNHAFQATPHRCDAPQKGNYYTNCDRGGCSQNTRDQGNAFGPGGQFSLNTLKPFVVETSFPINDQGQLVGMRTVLKQGSSQVVMDHASCAADYLASLTEAMKEGMALIFSYWGSDSQTMSWMDMPPCGPEACTGPNSGLGSISKMVVRDYEGSVPAPPAAPATGTVPVPAPTPSPPPPAPVDLALAGRQGPIRWQKNQNMCLTAQGAWPHAPVIIMECQGPGATADLQAFVTSGDDNKLRLAVQRDRCVSVLDHVASNGARVEMAECLEGESSQNFGYPASDGKIHWAGQPYMCLDIKNHGPDNGTPFQLWECLDDDDDQKFVWKDVPIVDVPASEATWAYNCTDDGSGWFMWETSKREWCCKSKGKGCGAVPTTTRPLFDCSFGYPDWVPMWSSEKKGFCCQQQQRGCPGIQLPVGDSGTASSSSPGASSPSAGIEEQLMTYDCFSFLQDGWSEAHKNWCCTYEQVSCSYDELKLHGALEPLANMVYDCEWGKETWYLVWSMAQADWCCKASGIGCRGAPLSLWPAAAAAAAPVLVPHVAPADAAPPLDSSCPFDCNEDKDGWMLSWPQAKRTCCCAQTGLEGCSQVLPAVGQVLARFERLPEAPSLASVAAGARTAAAAAGLGLATMAVAVVAVRRLTSRRRSRLASSLWIERPDEPNEFFVE